MNAHHRVPYLAGAFLLALTAFAGCGGGDRGGGAGLGIDTVPNGSMGQSQSVGGQAVGTESFGVAPGALPAPFHFSLRVSGGAKACLPNAAGTATISAINTQEENLHIAVSGLPHSTDFDVFIIQIPVAPFGLAWYQGDIDTTSTGTGAVDFRGRFSIETFIVAPGVAPAPTPFHSPPFPDAASNPKTGPVQTYHVGIWFNSPADAGKAHCPTTVTPFNGTHNAGIQVLNTANFATLNGPLRQFHP